MNIDALVNARNSYAYVPACLVKSPQAGEFPLPFYSLYLNGTGPTADAWGAAETKKDYSSMKLDIFHHHLLTSASKSNRLHGLLSVLFWGYASGTDHVLRYGRALAKARAVLAGQGANQNPQPENEIHQHLRNALALMKEGRIKEALIETLKIKYLGMSFASKVLTFMDPNSAAVYDSVISDRLRDSNQPKLNCLYVSTKNASNKSELEAQAATYEKWCIYCSGQARVLNETGVQWTDWNSEQHAWRAVDVERAFFALGR